MKKWHYTEGRKGWRNLIYSDKWVSNKHTHNRAVRELAEQPHRLIWPDVFSLSHRIRDVWQHNNTFLALNLAYSPAEDPRLCLQGSVKTGKAFCSHNDETNMIASASECISCTMEEHGVVHSAENNALSLCQTWSWTQTRVPTPPCLVQRFINSGTETMNYFHNWVW